jgi:hypothetical protein
VGETIPGVKPGSIYAIYYGWLTEDDAGEPNEDALRIAGARVPLLLANVWTAAPERHLNLSAAVLALLRSSNTEVFAYIATHCGKASLKATEQEVDECMAAGVDGIFFDEADPLREKNRLAYYDTLARRIRAHGGRVIMNPGVARCGERVMDVSDVLMVEHQWRDLREESVWMMRYASERFMGVSSNEVKAMGYTVDEKRAVADTREAWRRGIGWHASTESYTQLPEWFERYVQSVAQ